jgi:hypothetical protein
VQFERVGVKFFDLRADEALSSAASGVSQLATGPARTRAQENIATQMKSLADGARICGQAWKALCSNISRRINPRPEH